MFIKTIRKPLKYNIMVRCPGGEWIDGPTLTSYDAADEYMSATLKGKLDCAIVVTRGGQFEYERRCYA